MCPRKIFSCVRSRRERERERRIGEKRRAEVRISGRAGSQGDDFRAGGFWKLTPCFISQDKKGLSGSSARIYTSSRHGPRTSSTCRSNPQPLRPRRERMCSNWTAETPFPFPFEPFRQQAYFGFLPGGTEPTQLPALTRWRMRHQLSAFQGRGILRVEMTCFLRKASHVCLVNSLVFSPSAHFRPTWEGHIMGKILEILGRAQGKES